MKTLCSMFLLLLLSACSRPEQSALTRQSGTVDLARYQGTWYEIARLPMPFQAQCVSDARAEYSLQANGTVRVLNSCRNQTGAWEQAEGRAKALSADNTQLQVSFLPSWLSWLPMGWGDYWILKLDEDYQTVLIGEPQLRYLWLLTRQPKLATETQSAFLDHARHQGYDLSTLQFTTHTKP